MPNDTRTSSPAAPPLAYERGGAEAIAGVCRDGDLLVAHRGADLSRFCIRCGRPAAGAPIVRRLIDRRNVDSSSSFSRDDSCIGALIALLFVLLSLSTYVRAARASLTPPL